MIRQNAQVNMTRQAAASAESGTLYVPSSLRSAQNTTHRAAPGATEHETTVNLRRGDSNPAAAANPATTAGIPQAHKDTGPGKANMITNAPAADTADPHTTDGIGTQPPAKYRPIYGIPVRVGQSTKWSLTMPTDCMKA